MRTEARPKAEELGLCQNAWPKDLNKVESPSGPQFPLGLMEPLCPSLLEEAQGRLRAQKPVVRRPHRPRWSMGWPVTTGRALNARPSSQDLPGGKVGPLKVSAQGRGVVS